MRRVPTAADAQEHLSIGMLVTVVALITLSSVVEVVVHERVGYDHTIRALEHSSAAD